MQAHAQAHLEQVYLAQVQAHLQAMMMENIYSHMCAPLLTSCDSNQLRDCNPCHGNIRSTCPMQPSKLVAPILPCAHPHAARCKWECESQ